jgi:hypothetical protein
MLCQNRWGKRHIKQLSEIVKLQLNYFNYTKQIVNHRKYYVISQMYFCFSQMVLQDKSTKLIRNKLFLLVCLKLPRKLKLSTWDDLNIKRYWHWISFIVSCYEILHKVTYLYIQTKWKCEIMRFFLIWMKQKIYFSVQIYLCIVYSLIFISVEGFFLHYIVLLKAKLPCWRTNESRFGDYQGRFKLYTLW